MLIDILKYSVYSNGHIDSTYIDDGNEEEEEEHKYHNKLSHLCDTIYNMYKMCTYICDGIIVMY